MELYWNGIQRKAVKYIYNIPKNIKKKNAFFRWFRFVLMEAKNR
jgi:hypothetical protein